MKEQDRYVGTYRSFWPQPGVFQELGQRFRQESRRQVNRIDQWREERARPKDPEKGCQAAGASCLGQEVGWQKVGQKSSGQGLGQEESQEPLIRCVWQANRRL